jgi:hypothetical protein
MNVRRFKPTGTMIVVVAALVIGLEAPAMAHQVNVAAHKISGSELKNNSVTGKQVKESTLGVVPKAKKLTKPKLHKLTTLESGWSDYGESENPAGYYKDGLGVVHLTGAIAGGTVANYAFTLPKGFRGEGFFSVSSSDSGGTSEGPCDLTVYPSGDVYVQTGCDNYQVGLDGVTFRALG